MVEKTAEMGGYEAGQRIIERISNAILQTMHRNDYGCCIKRDGPRTVIDGRFDMKIIAQEVFLALWKDTSWLNVLEYGKPPFVQAQADAQELKRLTDNDYSFAKCVNFPTRLSPTEAADARQAAKTALRKRWPMTNWNYQGELVDFIIDEYTKALENGRV